MLSARRVVSGWRVHVRSARSRMLTGQAKGQGKSKPSVQAQKEQVLKDAQQSEGGMFGNVPVATMMITLGAAYGAKSKVDELRTDASQRSKADAEWPRAMALVRSVAPDFPPPGEAPKKATAKAATEKSDKSKAAAKKPESKTVEESASVQSGASGASPLGVTEQQKVQLAKLQASEYLQQLVADEEASVAQAAESSAATAAGVKAEAATDATSNVAGDAKPADAEPASDSEHAASTSESSAPASGEPSSLHQDNSPHTDTNADADTGADAGADATAGGSAEISAHRAELDELEARARRLRADVVGGVIADEKAHEMALRQELEDRALADLDKLDEAQLRERLVRLVAETSERAQWQAYAHLQTVRHVEAKLAEQNTEMMGMQREKMAATHGLELEEQERRLARGFEDEMEQLKTVADERLADALAEQEVQLKSDSEAALEKAIGDLREEIEAARLSDTETRLAQLERLSQRVSALDQVFERDTDTTVFSHQVHKLSSATMALSSKAEESVPLHAEFKLLQDAGQGDDVVELALASLSSRVRNTGAMTTAQLRRRFEDVAEAARKAELAPANTMLGHAMGSLFAAVMLRPRGVLDGDDIDARLSRVDHHLDAGDLRAAVSEVMQLQGLSAEAAEGWLVSARDRLALDQAITLVKTHTTLLAASLR